MSVIFLFIDGVGLGDENGSNPFHEAEFSAFNAMAGEQLFSRNAQELNDNDHVFRHIDANLGVEGLPQSGTGQTALFTGKNASREIGKHFGPFPHSGIKPFLKADSIFSRLQQLDKNCEFINAYPDIFFQKAQERNRWSCTTLMTKSAGIKLNTVEKVKQENALTAEITQQAWKEKLNIDVPEITPEIAAARIINQLDNYDLILYEYYLTDKAGHSQDLRRAYGFLKTYDRFLSHLLEYKNDDTTVILSSDHGNIEDLSIKTHTRNKVPLFVKGPAAPYFHNANSITDVTPGIVDYFSNDY